MPVRVVQLGLGYPAWKSGLASSPFAIGSVLVASAGSRQALSRGPGLVAFGLATVPVGLAGVWLAVAAHPGHEAGLWTALPLLIAGLGGGLVISPNLTLTLSQVPVKRAGSAFRHGLVTISAFAAAALALVLADAMTRDT
jgi:hypothetical protein